MRLAQKFIREFTTSYIKRFPGTNNSHSDSLATSALAINPKLKRTIEVEYLPNLSIKTGWQLKICDVEECLGISWMDPIIRYLKDGTLPNDSNKAYRV